MAMKKEQVSPQAPREISGVPFACRYYTGQHTGIIEYLGLPSDFYRDNGVEFILSEKYQTGELKAALVEKDRLDRLAERYRERSAPCPRYFIIEQDENFAAITRICSAIAAGLVAQQEAKTK